MNPCDKLTEREREVLRLRARGMGPGEIARQLRITPHTARKHLDNAVRRTGTGDLVVTVVLLDRMERTAST